ncbi:MAG: type II 3-dehydroquinate dehydratase [Bacteroidales bacterium]
MKLLILNGPNLNMQGKREPEIYGSGSFEDFFSALQTLFTDIELTYKQSNVEGELINLLQQANEQVDGVLLNGGGYTHTSVALADAVASIQIPVLEIHISNLLTREAFRHTSYLGPVCKGSIMGLGLDGYRLGVEAMRLLVKK